MPPASPTVSVLLVTYRRPQFLRAAVASLLRQRLQDWELAIVDDSEDEVTGAIVAAWSTEARIRYFHRCGKGGYANALNFGLDHTTGAYVAILDDDDCWLDPAKLSKQVKYLDANPACGVCGGWFHQIGADGGLLARIRGPESDAQIRERMLFANAMANSTVLFRRELGRYDETMRHTADWDLWLRAGVQWKFHNLPEFLAGYRCWPGGGSALDARAHVLDRVLMWRRYHKYYPRSGKALTLIGLKWLHARLPPAATARLLGRFPRAAKALRRWTYPHTSRWIGSSLGERREF
jgi:glycosyltransferase involved in cell wall biosynthesis